MRKRHKSYPAPSTFRRRADHAARRILLLSIQAYRLILRPLLPVSCRFAPSCSQFAIDAIAAHGPIRGTWLAVRRVGRCHPWNAGGYDPVPARKG